MTFSDFPPGNIVKLGNVGPTLSNFGQLLSDSSVAITVVNNFVTSTRHFRSIPTPSTDFQVSLNLGKTAPLIDYQ